MTSGRLILRSLLYHARAHVGAFLGTAVASAVLVGALVVGDSVRGSLRAMALARLGNVEVAMATGDRLFRADLFGSGVSSLAYVQTQPGLPGLPVLSAAVLQLPAVAVAAGGAARANEVQVLGVDARFRSLARQPPDWINIPPGTLVLNQPLARQLRAKVGDEILLRVQRPAALSRDAPLAPEENAAVALRMRVHAVARDDHFGRFGLAANQRAPLNAFMSLTDLQSRLGVLGRANLLLAGSPPPTQQAMTVSSAFAVASPTVLTNALEATRLAVRQRWTLDDAELELRPVPGNRGLELRSRRVFLDEALGETIPALLVTTNFTAVAPGVRAEGVLTYFVNELRVGDRATPYSMVTAATPALLPGELGDDEILLSRWLADDLAAKPGDELSLTYYAVGTSRELIERTARFRVRGIHGMDAPGIDRSLMPDFPGMTEAQSCREWDTGLPIQTDRIRPKDEDYWRQYRGTPKALITLAAGQRLWANRFGNLTAIRFVGAPAGATGPAAAPSLRPSPLGGPGGDPLRLAPMAAANLPTALTRGLDPALLGLSVQPVREQALAASQHGQDFGGLFLGFSFFLIAAALLLVHLLFQFGIETRATEVGTLLALGFRPGQARRLLLGEGGLVASMGAVAGTFGGVGYADAMLRGLTTVWAEAVGGVALSLHVERWTVIGGAALAVFVTVLAMGLALRRQTAQPARVLLASGADLENLQEAGAGTRTSRVRPRVYQGIAAAAVTIALLLALASGDAASAGRFFGAGVLLLLAGLAGGSAWLARWDAAGTETKLTVGNLAIRGATRRRRRSLAVVALLASGSFLIAAIGVFRLQPVSGGQPRSAGTGGFALIGQSSQPVLHDLDSARGREAYGLDAAQIAGSSVVAFRVRDGDEASCLNLNRAQRPRLLGVNPDALARRGAFTFAQIAQGHSRTDGWTLLRAPPTPGPGGAEGTADEIPAIGDQASIQWALGKKVGDTIPITDERGRTFQLRLVGAVANSVLQGNLVIAEEEFVKRFPGATGYRMFLVDAPSNRVDTVAAELTRGLQDLGLELTPAGERLAAFNAVQNTYLGTFQVLGGLGLLLGSVGLGVVVLRNVLERRGELALLLAVGWERGTLRRMILVEHGVLLAAGLVLGAVAAVVAVLPPVLTMGTEVPYRSLGWTLAAVLANGWLWTLLATLVALRGRVLDALRNS